MNIHVSPAPDDDAVAAVLAALEHYLAAEQADDEAPAGPHSGRGHSIGALVLEAMRLDDEDKREEDEWG